MTPYPPNRVTKRTAPSRIHTRQRSRLATETSVGCAVSLQRMVDEATHGLQGDGEQHGGEENRAKGKGRAQEEQNSQQQQPPPPLVSHDFGDRPFPLMSLPAEIRNEIYRACLTRPFNIVLSRREPPPEATRSSCEDMSSDDEVRTEECFGGSQPAASGPDARRRLRSSRRLDFSHPSHRLQRTGSVRYPDRFTLASASDGGEPSVPSVTINLPPQDSANPPRRVQSNGRSAELARARRPQDADPLLVGILRVSKQVYQEARSILYNENCFTLDLDTALPTLAALHQRSRRQIKYVELEIPCYNEILERFQETVRLSLRYCWGLKTFVIHMPFTLPGADGSGTTGNTTVYANGFDILRWLPRQCEVVLKGNICSEISAVVSKNANLAKSLDELAYARRQLISNETGDRS